MATHPQVTPTNDKKWNNRHDTFSQPVDNLFDIANADTGNMLDDYNSTTAAIQDLIARAILQKKSLRALGGGWSFTGVAATDGWMVNTKQLNMTFAIRRQSIDKAFSGLPDQLLFAQCGMSIQELNTFKKQG